MRIWKTGISAIALLAMTGQAYASICDAGTSAALKTAAVQQELMVAGLMCRDVSAYNRFVLAYQGDLQKSDAALMAYFRDRDGSEAGYDSYKTKLANLAASRSSADGARYCAAVNADFAAAEKSTTLSDFIAHDRLLIAAPEACAVKFDPVEVAVAGVPAHDLPATPYGRADAPPAALAAASRPEADSRAADTGRRQAYNDLPRPPRYARSRWRDEEADDDYYAPPPGWLPRSRRSWYEDGVYNNW